MIISVLDYHIRRNSYQLFVDIVISLKVSLRIFALLLMSFIIAITDLDYLISISQYNFNKYKIRYKDRIIILIFL